MMTNKSSVDRTAGHCTADLKTFVWKVVNKEFTPEDAVDYILKHGIEESLDFFRAASRVANTMHYYYWEFDTKEVPCEQNNLLQGTGELPWGKDLDIFLIKTECLCDQLKNGVRARFWYPDVEDPENYPGGIPYYYRDLTQQEIIDSWLGKSLPHRG